MYEVRPESDSVVSPRHVNTIPERFPATPVGALMEAIFTLMVRTIRRFGGGAGVFW